MDDDFNTGVGVAALFDLVRSLNKLADTEKLEEVKPSAAKVDQFKRGAAVLRELSATLGLFLKPVETKAAGGDDALVGQLVELLIEARANARKNKDFATADTIRKRLGELSARLGDAEWLDGRYSAGDLLMVSVLLRLKSSGMLDKYPKLSAYVARGEARPAYRRAFDAQLAVFTAAAKG